MVQAHKPRTLARLFNTFGPFLGLLLVLGLFSLSPTIRAHFFSGQSFKTILTQTVIIAIGTLGMTMIIVSGGIDLSVGSAVALASVVGAVILDRPDPSCLGAATLTILTGALVGFVNGFVIGGLRMMPFIVTLGMMGVARGTAKWLARSQTVIPHENRINNLMTTTNSQHFFPLPWGVWITVGLAVLTAVVMRKTVFGRYLFAIGANETAARLSGIRVPLYKIIIYSVAGVFFGVAGLMQLSRLNEGDPTGAFGLELDIIAAVVIGGASLSGGTGSIAGSLIGALIMAVLKSASNQMDWPNYVQEIIIGGVIIVAVGVDQLRQKQR